MGMLHPRYNHLGRSKKKAKKPTKAQLAAQAEHEKFLASHGLKPATRRIKLKGCVPVENPSYVRRPDLPPTSDVIGGWAPKRELR